MQGEWARLLIKLGGMVPLPIAVRRHAESNMHRYFARLAYESGRYRTSMRLLGRGLWFAPAFFLADRRNWLVLAAASAGVFLPKWVRRRLERLFGLHPLSASSEERLGAHAFDYVIPKGPARD